MSATRKALENTKRTIKELEYKLLMAKKKETFLKICIWKEEDCNDGKY